MSIEGIEQKNFYSMLTYDKGYESPSRCWFSVSDLSLAFSSVGTNGSISGLTSSEISMEPWMDYETVLGFHLG